MALQLPPLALYIHIPWCIQKCPYCDFNSHAVKQGIPEQEYIAHLLADLEQDLPLVTGRSLSSIFIGGGTPSVFSAAGISQILTGVKQRLNCDADMEVTMEANPGTVEAERFAAYVQAGVTRFSIGVQSFQTAQLQALGRIHDSGEAIRAAQLAQNLPLDSFNLDLMHGLPQQDIAGALADLQRRVVAAENIVDQPTDATTRGRLTIVIIPIIVPATLGAIAPAIIPVIFAIIITVVLTIPVVIPTVRAAIGAAHRRFGTTGFLPTLISDDLEVIDRAIDAVEAAISLLD